MMANNGGKKGGGSPASALYFLKAFGHAAMAVGQFVTAREEEQEYAEAQEEAERRPRRRPRRPTAGIANPSRAGKKNCCGPKRRPAPDVWGSPDDDE